MTNPCPTSKVKEEHTHRNKPFAVHKYNKIVTGKPRGYFFYYVKLEHGVFGQGVLKMAGGADWAILVKKHVDSEDANCTLLRMRKTAFHISCTEMILRNIWKNLSAFFIVLISEGGLQ